MPQFVSTLKAVGSVLSRGGNSAIRQFVRTPEKHKYNRISCLSSLVRVDRRPYRETICGNEDCSDRFSGSLCSSSCFVQTRRFLGCGDGDEGGGLSRVYEERRVLGYSPEQLFDVVASVDLYHGFVPWCQRSDIIRHYPDGSFDAELVIGFKFLVESYVSHVELDRPRYIKTTVKDTGLFDHLINIWEFNPGPLPGTCNLHFLVDFKFQSPLYRQVASMFFREVVSKLVGSFTDRCRIIYGPAVPVIENSYEQRA